MTQGGPHSHRALILTPSGRDARLAAALMSEAGCHCLVCSDAGSLLDGLRAGAGLAIVAEEALKEAALGPIGEWVRAQPAWSDFPFIVLTLSSGRQRSPLLTRIEALLGNVSFIERPFHATSFVSNVRAALRARQRQYDARARIEEVQRQEEQLRVAQEAGGVGAFELFPDSGMVSMSAQFCRLFGLQPRASAHLRDLYRLVHEDDRERVASVDPTLDHALQYVEYRIRRPSDGALRWIARQGERIPAAGEAPLRYLGVIYDITKAKQTQQSLLTSEAALRRLNETLESRVAERTRDRDRMWRLSPDVMLVARFNGDIVGMNPAWTRLLGWQEDDLLGHSLFALIHPDDVAATLDDVGHLAQASGVRRFENRCRHRDGSYRLLAWTAVPEDALIQAVGRDVTAEREQAEALRQAEDALRQSQKMEAVGQLTGGIAHDFNNLLQGIVGSLDLVRKRIGEGRTGELTRFVDSAMSSAQRAAALTHRLLAFSRRQPLAPKPLQANPLIASMEDLLLRTLGERIALRLSLATDLWTTLCDPNQLESAVLNLAINARDAMPAPSPGELSIATSNARLDARDAARAGVAPGDYVAIAVTDNGTGMPPDVVARAFEPFFTTKPLGQGTGLGLSMIYGFARQSGGGATIESRPGRGTTIRLHVPRHAGEAASDEPVGLAHAPPVSDAGEVVAVVEDETVVRELIVEVLSELGYRTIQASDGPTGVEVLAAAPRVDLLITDVGLPGLNGRQVADAARETRPDLKVLFMTGYAETATGTTDFLEPGMELIAKPFAVDALAERVRALIERH